MGPDNLLAQNATNLGRLGGEGLGPFGNVSLGPTESLQAVTRIISGVVGFITVAAGVWFIFQFLIAGINWISAEGDAKKLQQAQQRIMSALLGLIVVVAGMVILALASKFLGYDFLITNPGDIINKFNIRP